MRLDNMPIYIDDVLETVNCKSSIIYNQQSMQIEIQSICDLQPVYFKPDIFTISALIIWFFVCILLLTLIIKLWRP